MILVINCGSSSLKFQLYGSGLKSVPARGLVSRIGEGESHFSVRLWDRTVEKAMPVPDHRGAFQLAIGALLDPTAGVLRDINDIVAVGHRVVHGGDRFVSSVLIDDDVLTRLESCSALAPLHNPANLMGIREARRLLPRIAHVAVFDTAFHQSLPPRAYVFPIPYRFHATEGLRRYGFHGTSCRYVAREAARLLDRPLEELRLVICHLGNGVTIDAVQGGKSVDTSMGFATCSGTMMGTRSGDLDPSVIFFLHQRLGLDVEEIERICYQESGLLGVSGVSNDMRTVMEQDRAGNERCRLAIEMFAYGVRKSIGAYAAAMGGIDGLVFTAGIGENSPDIRERICQDLDFLGIRLDPSRNRERGVVGRISIPQQTIPVLVVPTDEERMIALDTCRLAGIGLSPG